MKEQFSKEAKERQKAAGETHGRGQEVKEKVPEPIAGQARDKAGEAVGVDFDMVRSLEKNDRSPCLFLNLRQRRPRWKMSGVRIRVLPKLT